MSVSSNKVGVVVVLLENTVKLSVVSQTSCACLVKVLIAVAL